MELIIALVVVGGLILFLLATYNALVHGRVGVQEGWSAIEVQLQRRASLIPNLVETVKGYAAHEQDTLQNVTAARSALQNASGPAQAAQADNMLTQTLRSLFAVAEAYPDLKADQNFQQLQQQLAETEDKISYARNYYNGTVKSYNLQVQSVPAVFVAGLLGFKSAEFFDAPDAATQDVQVSFQRN
jgi:LemA protein